MGREEDLNVSTSHKKLKSSKKKKKRRRSSSSSSSSSSERERRKEKKRKKKEEKKTLKKLKKIQERLKIKYQATTDKKKTHTVDIERKRLKPMTKEQWLKQSNEVRREKDPYTGRERLIKGEGEVIEEIVSHSRQKEINRLATEGDGKYYQNQISKL